MEKEEQITEYIKNGRLDIDTLINHYYSYIDTVIKHLKGVAISEEDIQEMVSDVFLAIWKNYHTLNNTTAVRPYLVGIAKNILKNRYRNTNIDISLDDYPEIIQDEVNLDKTIEEKEQNRIIEKAVKSFKKEEYTIFIGYYYHGKKVKELAQELKITESNAKVILYRVRKKIKKELRKGGYSYGK